MTLGDTAKLELAGDPGFAGAGEGLAGAARIELDEEGLAGAAGFATAEADGGGLAAKALATGGLAADGLAVE